MKCSFAAWISDDVLPLLIAFGFGFSVGGLLMGNAFENAAMKRGFVVHCENDRGWAWKGECDE